MWSDIPTAKSIRASISSRNGLKWSKKKTGVSRRHERHGRKTTSKESEEDATIPVEQELDM